MEMNIYNAEIVCITPFEMNELIKQKMANKERFQYVENWPRRGDFKTIRGINFIKNSLVNFEMLTLEAGKQSSVIYYIKKDRNEAPDPKVPTYKFYANFRRYCKGFKEYPQEVCDTLPSASPLLDFNPDYDKTEQEAYCYDINSAYAYAFSNIWGDFTKDPYVNVDLKDNQFGFNECYVDNAGVLMWQIELEPGTRCRFAFDRLPVPEAHLKFINKWYEKKKTATNPIDKKYAKDMLNIPIGYLQNKNPFIRLMVVCYCNKYVDDLLDENSLYWNTDSIISKVRRPDLEANIGKELGQWKLEEEGLFYHIGFNYQWNNDIIKISLRGTPNNWAEKGWILKNDGTPRNRNIWEFNKKTLQLEVRNG